MASSSTVVYEDSIVPTPANYGNRKFTYSFVADSGDGSVDAEVMNAKQVAELRHLGYYLWLMVTNPGTTAPTDDWDITVVDGDGVDMLNSQGTDRDTTNTEIEPLAVPFPVSTESITINISGNSVNSAIIVVHLHFARY